jgi:hypothetical protein
MLGPVSVFETASMQAQHYFCVLQCKLVMTVHLALYKQQLRGSLVDACQMSVLVGASVKTGGRAAKGQLTPW